MKLQNIIALKQFDEDHKGRVINSRTLLEQIGRMNWLAISGGRYEVFNSTVFLPVANGYWVSVTLDASDTYTVRRVFIRNGRVLIKRVWSDVFASDVSETAYEASCFV
jgi:hypothetical protein